ncbi:MAG: hypothetical protein KDB22_30330, partial [Planctomycetales bacterium]|nr:hypothetical protein [Planctomycetales bacterium]
LGRCDNQVKIRGFRVEPGEVELSLERFSSVDQAVVTAHRDSNGSNYLVGYYTPLDGKALAIEDLRSHLLNELPDYMIPSVFVPLETIPHLPNGKVDRRSLPVPDGVRPELKAPFVAPRNQLETRAAAIWAEVLQLDRVGVHDQFFDLGGHSLLATQVLARFRREFAVELPLRMLFEKPTIAQLAGEIEIASKGCPIPAIEVQTRPDIIPLSFAQQRLWFLDQLQPENPFYNI